MIKSSAKAQPPRSGWGHKKPNTVTNPTINAHNPFDEAVQKEETEQEAKEIESKLIAVSETVVMNEIIEERAKGIEKIGKESATLHHMMTELATMVKEQESSIYEIYNNISDAHARAKAGCQNILQADQLHRADLPLSALIVDTFSAMSLNNDGKHKTSPESSSKQEPPSHSLGRPSASVSSLSENPATKRSWSFSSIFSRQNSHATDSNSNPNH